MTSEYSSLRWSRDGQVATVWLDRPPVNAVDQAMYREIKRLFSDVSQLGDDVRAIVLTGAGQHFCAGNDLNEFVSLNPENAPGRMLEVREAFFAIQDCQLPVVGAVQGTAVGTGLAIAASCDFVIASDDARIGVTEVKVGMMGAAKHLARLVPEPFMRWMYLSGEPVTAQELYRLGAIVAVVPRDELLPEAQRRASAIAQHSPVVLSFAKRSMNHIEEMGLREAYPFEQSLSGELSAYEDPKEALRAFFERRAPTYQGC